MINDFLLQAFDMAHISYKKDEPLSSKTTFKIGSTADLFIAPDSVQQLQSVIGAIKADEDKFFILGGGSNIVFPDNPYNGIIVSTENLNNILMTDDELPSELSPDSVLVTCQAGTTIASFVNFCTKHSLSGAEQFAGLPGTIGGAVYMNARCFEKSISDILFQTEHLEYISKNNVRLITKNVIPSEWDYKKSPFQTNPTECKIVTSATFILTKKSADFKSQIEENCKKYIAERVEKGHFKFPSAGSVFKNNRSFGKPSGKIIDEAGLRGSTIGGAQIAPFHGNFIININKASAKDVSDLVELAKTTVKQKFNFDLEPEIIFVK